MPALGPLRILHALSLLYQRVAAVAGNAATSTLRVSAREAGGRSGPAIQLTWGGADFRDMLQFRSSI